jgi:glycosyltransferase involved in cell wall biosynthesis
MTVPLKIAYDMTFPNRNQAGTGVYARELLAELVRRDDVTMTAVAAVGDGFPRTMRWMLGAAGHASVDAQLVHCPAFVAPWRLGKPLVLTVHDTSTTRFREDLPPGWRAYTRLFLASRSRAALRVITGSEYSKREIARDSGVPADRIAVTPYGVAERFSKVERRAVMGDPPLLLFPGAPIRRKNLELVLRAMADAPAESALKRSRLAITGANADEFPDHRARIETLGLKDRVDWRGKLPAESMPQFIGAANLVVYPSWHEGFGFPALEAMAAGTPVVASDAACLPEVLGDGALLVDPTDVKAFTAAVEAVLTQDELRADLIAKGRARAARYTWKRCAELTADVYREAAAAAAMR